MAVTKCPKCGYVRQPNETVSEFQCPSCKVMYAKHVPVKEEGAQKRAAIKAKQDAYDKGPLMLLAKIFVGVGVLVGLSFLTPFPGWIYFKVTGRQYETMAERDARHEREAVARRRAMMETAKIDLSGARITMYSSKYCGNCDVMRRVLESRGVPFNEFMIDSEPPRAAEMQQKLQSAGYDANNPRLPTMEVNGKLMVDPSWLEVLKVAAEVVPR